MSCYVSIYVRSVIEKNINPSGLFIIYAGSVGTRLDPRPRILLERTWLIIEDSAPRWRPGILCRNLRYECSLFGACTLSPALTPEERTDHCEFWRNPETREVRRKDHSYVLTIKHRHNVSESKKRNRLRKQKLSSALLNQIICETIPNWHNKVTI